MAIKLTNEVITAPANTFEVFSLATGLTGKSMLNLGRIIPAIYGKVLGLTQEADYPTVNNVRDGISYGNATYTGNMTEPTPADVKQGTQYGANGTEFTGTYARGGKKNFGFNF